VEHGDLRVPHFLGLHALQVLPLLAFAFSRKRWTDTTRARLVLVAGASYALLFLILLAQALRGQSVVRPDAVTIALLEAWAALTGAAAWIAARHRRTETASAVFIAV
jgi:hypothetical protein